MTSSQIATSVNRHPKTCPQLFRCLLVKKKNLLRILALTGKYKRTFWAETWWCSEFFQSTFFFFVGTERGTEIRINIFQYAVGILFACFFFFGGFFFFKPLDLALLLHRLKNFLNNYHGR